MKYTLIVNQIFMRRLILMALAMQGVIPCLNAANAVMARKKIYQKSLLDLYRIEGKEADSVSGKTQECVTCKVRKCHDNHKYCPICQEKCQTCPKNCKDCKVSCSICLESHKQLGEKEVVLECNHVFGAECLKSWENVSLKGDCPLCRKEIAYKMCALCNDTIYEWESSCEYDCEYRWWKWEREHHTFHSRCIVPFALKAARISDKATQDLKGAEITFHCPVLHQMGSGNSKTDLKVPLCKVIPSHKIDKQLIPASSAIRDKNRCDLCHRDIVHDQKRSTYTCKYRSFGWNEPEEHNFHQDCLKPYVERNAYKQKKYGEETGKVVFSCPVDHEHGVWYPEADLEIDLTLLPDFKPESALFHCAVCKKLVEIDDPKTIKAEFNGFPPGLNVDRVQEITYYHPKCFGEFVARTARKQTTWHWKGWWWRSELKVVYPCPCHENTKWAHDYDLPLGFPVDIDAL